MKLSTPLKFIISIFVTQLTGFIGSSFTMSGIDTWYAFLNKPALTPPDWVFGLVWSILFLLMGIALFLVWNNKGAKRKETKVALQLFAIQLCLNLLWSIMFFSLNNIPSAFLELISLWTALLATMLAFYKISRPAAYLLIPYLLWITFAGYLNYMIMCLN